MTNNTSALAILDKPVVNSAPKKPLHSNSHAAANKPDGSRDANVPKEHQDVTPKDFKETMAGASQEKGGAPSSRLAHKAAEASEKNAVSVANSIDSFDNIITDTADVLMGATILPSVAVTPLEVNHFGVTMGGAVLDGEPGEGTIKPDAPDFNTAPSAETALPIVVNTDVALQKAAIPELASAPLVSALKGQGEPVLNARIKVSQEAALPSSTLAEGDTAVTTSTFVTKKPSSATVIPVTNGQLTQAISDKFTAQNSQGLTAKVSPRETMIGEKSFAHQISGAVKEEQESKPSFSVNDLSLKTSTPSVDRVFVSANIRFGQPAWAGQIAERSANLASQNIKQAEIQLNPQDMGPINIKISIANEQATVTFAAQNAAVREALDTTMQRLKEAFNEEGLELVQADVTDQQSSNNGDPEGESGSDGVSDGPDNSITDKHVAHIPQSAIDHFV